MDPLVLAKFAEIDCSLLNLCGELHATSVALTAGERIFSDAKLKVQALKDRRQEIAADVAIIKEMLGVK